MEARLGSVRSSLTDDSLAPVAENASRETARRAMMEAQPGKQAVYDRDTAETIRVFR